MHCFISVVVRYIFSIRSAFPSVRKDILPTNIFSGSKGGLQSTGLALYRDINTRTLTYKRISPLSGKMY